MISRVKVLLPERALATIAKLELGQSGGPGIQSRLRMTLNWGQ